MDLKSWLSVPGVRADIGACNVNSGFKVPVCEGPRGSLVFGLIFVVYLGMGMDVE
jgi:hypothetical protein